MPWVVDVDILSEFAVSGNQGRLNTKSRRGGKGRRYS
jgi:hypothetical protein